MLVHGGAVGIRDAGKRELPPVNLRAVKRLLSALGKAESASVALHDARCGSGFNHDANRLHRLAVVLCVDCARGIVNGDMISAPSERCHIGIALDGRECHSLGVLGMELQDFGAAFPSRDAL